MPEPVTGMRGTKYADLTETSLDRDVADRINFLQPNASPLLTLINSLRREKVATEAKYEWFESSLSPNVVADASGAGTGTTLNVATGTGVRVRINDILVAPNGEAALVTNISTDALTVSRSIGPVAAFTSITGTEWVIIGSAHAEGSSIPTAKWMPKTNKKNFIQIFRDIVHLTDVQTMVKSFGGDDRVHQRMRVSIEHKRSIEQAFWFGDAFEDSSGTQMRRGTGGVINFITTNVQDFGGVITEPDFETLLRAGFRYEPTAVAGQKTLFAAPMMISAINFWAKSALQTKVDEKKYGMRISTYVSGQGDLDIVKLPLFLDFQEFQKWFFIIEPGNVSARFLDGGNTKLRIDIQNKGDLIAQDEYLSYKGFQIEQELTHAIGKNVTGFAA